MIILGFEYFHPLTGRSPNTFSRYGKDIIARARKLIIRRTDSEIFLIISFINWLIEQSPAKVDSEKVLNLLISDDSEPKELSEEELHLIELDISSSTYALKSFQANISLPLLDNVTNLLWSEIFAVLALSLIDKAIDDEKYYSGWGQNGSLDWLYEYRILSHSSAWLIEAMDAVATGESFRNIEDHINISKQTISLRNTAANISRHSRTNEAILAFDKFCDLSKHKSIRNSAMLFSEAYPEKVDHLSPYNRLRTLSNGLTAYRKGLRRTLTNP